MRRSLSKRSGPAAPAIVAALLAAGCEARPIVRGPAIAECARCHGAPPPSHELFPSASDCHACHPGTVNEDGTIVAGGEHMDGTTVASGASCAACHGAPPDTGAHRAHARPEGGGELAYGALTVLEDVAPSGGPHYQFGCGHCHPVDGARHMNGEVEVVLSPPATPVAGDDIKARNDPVAAFDRATGACGGVYCHSSGQQAPVFVASPAWGSAPGALGCAGCHANPPRHPSGGAGAADANSHLVLADDGWESGHFGGLPGPWHGSMHGGASSAGDDAAPITCQACHAETVDPAATGPSGFYWLDTTGDYQLPLDAPGADPSRGSGGTWYANLRCTTCHDGIAAPEAAGRVLPLRHVNGRRDVAFDARTTLPPIAWLPAAPNTPTRPYWVTTANPGAVVPDGIMDGTTLSAHLGGASYDPATKTCSSVACHLAQTEVTWGAPHGWSACSGCHAY